jgi:hypothetical protein
LWSSPGLVHGDANVGADRSDRPPDTVAVVTKVNSEQAQSSLTVEGGCLCGAVRYRVSGTPSRITICHCATCRHASGAPLVAWSGFPACDFNFTRGVPARYASSPGVERTFCSRCGTQLTYRHYDVPETLDLTLASLDNPEAIVPEDHVWTAHRLSWIAVADGLPAYSGNRTAAPSGQS